MQYQIDFGAGYENVHPDWYDFPDQEEDSDLWFARIAEEGVALRARVLLGGQEIEERLFCD